MHWNVRTILIIIFILISLVISVTSVGANGEDISVWQGQYYKGNKFYQGNFNFTFDVYDNKGSGYLCYTNTTNLTTGVFGEWQTEQFGFNTACNNASKQYYLKITIDDETQSPRRKLTTFNFLRKNVNETTDGALTTSKVIASNANITIEGENLIILANKSGFSRLILKNLDSGINTATIQTVENDIGYQFSMALTSSNFNLTQQFEGENRRNLGTITLNSPNSMQFLNRWDYPFLWRIAHNGTLTPQTEIMVLHPNGNLSIIGNFTSNDSGFFNYIGNLPKRVTKLFVQDIDINGTINSTGNIETVGNISASYFTGDGSLLTGISLNGTTTLTAYKSADQSIVSSTTLTNDTHLVLSLESNSKYTLDGTILSVSSSATPDMKIAFIVPSSSNMSIGFIAASLGVTRLAGVLEVSGTASSSIPHTVNVAVANHIGGYIETGNTAGVLQFQFAQNSVNAVATTAKKGSWIKLTKVT